MSRAAAWMAALWLAAFAGAAWGASAKEVAEGRYHLRKANGLAAEARCEGAVREYTLAYQKLHDPVVLFNRAECYRRLGQNAAASSDYRAFLDAVPRAPNRAEVEARLAALEGLPPPVVTPPPARAPSSSRATSAAALAPPPARAFEPPPAAPPPVVPVAPPTPSTAREAAAPPPPVPAPETPSAVDAPVVTSAEGSTAPAGGQPEGQRHLWLWAAIGAAVAGGAVGAYFALRSPGASPPATELGNYKF